MKYILFDIDGTLIKNSKNIPEVLPNRRETILKLKDKYKLGIYSQGFKFIQLLRLRLAGLYDLFDPNLIFISHDKLNLIDKIKAFCPKQDLLIIDNSKRISAVLEKSDINHILIETDSATLPDIVGF